MSKFFIIIILFLIFHSCTSQPQSELVHNNTCLSGHIMFIHIGEQNKPISPFLLYTPDDTTYLQYRKRSIEDHLFVDYSHGEGYVERNIEKVDTTIFKKIKEIIIKSPKNPVDTMPFGSGSFEVIIADKCNKINSNFFKGAYTDSLFSALSNLMKEEKINKSYERFEYYKKMQREYVY